MNEKKDISMELGSKMTKVASFLTFGKGISLFINLITFVIIARYIGPSNFGIYTIIMSIIALLSGFGNPNISYYLSKKIPRLFSTNKISEAKLMLGDTLLITLFFSIILSAVGIIFGTYFLSTVTHTYFYSLALLLGIPIIFFSLIYGNLYFYILGLNKGKELAEASIIHSITQFIFGVSLVLLGFGVAGGVSGYLMGLIISTLFEFFVILKLIGININLNGFKKRAKTILAFSKSLAYTNIINNVTSNFGILFLGIIVSASLVGYYGIASKIGSLLDVFIGAISLAILPMFSEAVSLKKEGANAGKLLFYSIYMGILFAMPLIMMFTVFSSEITFIVFSTAYNNAVPYMQLISIGILIGIFSTFGTNFLISSSKQKKVFKYAFISNLIQLIFIIILIPIFGVYGLVIATLFIGNIILNVLYLNYFSKIGIILHRNKMLRLILANVIFALILIPFTYIIPESVGLVLGILSIFLIYPILLGLIKGISKNDLDLINNASKSVPFFGFIIRKITAYAFNFCFS